MSGRPSQVFYKFKIILLGDSGVGKSSLLSRYMDEGFIMNKPCTINADFKIKNIKVDQSSTAQITIWDTCGQERYRAITRQYFKDAHGIILVYDVADKRSFSDLDIWIEEIKKNTIKKDLSIILVGNKIDLKFRYITSEEAKNFADNNNLMYCETSSKEGLNVEQAFEMVTKDIIIKQNNNNIFNDNEDLSPSNNIKNIKGKEKRREKEISCC